MLSGIASLLSFGRKNTGPSTPAEPAATTVERTYLVVRLTDGTMRRFKLRYEGDCIYSHEIGAGGSLSIVFKHPYGHNMVESFAPGTWVWCRDMGETEWLAAEQKTPCP